MTYYISPIWFYLMNVSTSLKVFLCVLGGLVLFISSIRFLLWLVDECGTLDYKEMDNDEKATLKLFKKIIIASFISLFIGIFVPSKETCIEMMIASQVTHENVTATKEEIYAIVDYITDKVTDKVESEEKR